MTRRDLLHLAGATALTARDQTNADAVCGTWVLQQVENHADFEAVTPKWIAPALKTPHVRGLSLRFPWKVVDEDLSLLDAGLDMAKRYGISFSLRFMAGRHTPARVFEAGSPFYRNARNEMVPAPFNDDGTPNAVFEREYRAYVTKLAKWSRANGVRLLHLAWYGQDWAELNHGKEVRAVKGYSHENWLKAHLRLIDIGLKLADANLACEMPFSGYGPLTDVAGILADHVVKQVGPAKPLFFCQANGWGPAGDWGAPNAATEEAFDKVWTRPICRALQAIQPSDYDWSSLYQRVYDNRATYCEVYAPSFIAPRKDLLFEEIRKFAEHCARKTPLPEAA